MKTSRPPIQGFILKPFRIFVRGHGWSHIYYAKNRSKALYKAFTDFQSSYDNVTFKEFLKMSHAASAIDEATSRFGEPIIVGGQEAFYVTHNRQYIHFVRPNSDWILASHPLDVEPPEARRGTPYYVPPATASHACS